MATKKGDSHLKKKESTKEKNVWLNEHGAYVDYSDTACAPCKDFYHVFVTPTQIIFRWWKIVPPTRADSNQSPFEIRDTYDDFLHDERCHSEIQRLAGDPTLQYLIGLAEGHVDYIDRIPDNVLEKMIAYLELEDIVRLGATSKKFRRLCNCDAVWEKIFRREVETPITPELEALAEKEGWKRLFYTNKLQLQVQLRRQLRISHQRK
ncbi:F-box only protein 36-like isoform X2 [Mya arenaria]|uniref:F-box only protein 36-like isoform X2 n=1 Tax=Mya arenaria TaxID=6604 RepID=UPI0022E4FA03|nr:F-box only protein 36-like isoform X2 [Mya arenaria]XP_052784377.1 F-box only protein 36-like isoform X2 [Mya arenaria]